ncbi:uncharacterized protein LOC122254403 [Penaeus japonicus]|uniref:uncharacterized protein LOC122254403 n=1 Tax=Penaeus japonicus TaxID=27405 RepID=UPI001C710802|nr:uncharacterized protein LOC122254403 [Penaeus japonicus]
MFPKRPLIVEGDAAAKKRKHKTISMLEKVELLQKLESGTSVRSLCEVYGISSSTVYDLKKQKEQIFSYFADNVSQKSLEKRKSLRRGKSTELDTALLRWFKQRRVEGVCVTGEMLMEQARVLHRELSLDHTCEYSQGWLHRFKGRYGISLLSAPGESIVAETEAEALDDCVRFEKAEKLSPEQICSTELSYHCIPRNTFVQDDEASIVGEISCGTESSAEESPSTESIPKENVPVASYDHHSSILKTLYDDSTFADVTLTAQGHLIRAHKAVLSAMSPYFREVLQANPCQHPIIIMPLDVQYEDLQGIISYIYNGQITLPSENLPSLLKTAKALQISGLATADIIDVVDEDEQAPSLKTVKVQSKMGHLSRSAIDIKSSIASSKKKKMNVTSTKLGSSLVFSESLDMKPTVTTIISKRRLGSDALSERETAIVTHVQNKSLRLRESEDNSGFPVIPDNTLSSEDKECEDFEEQKEELEDLQDSYHMETNSFLQPLRTHSSQQTGNHLRETVYVKEEPLF